MKTFVGWLHCANNTYDYFGHTKPHRLLFSESDIQWTMVKYFYKWDNRTFNKEYDLVFVNPGELQWHNDTKNWPLAIECFPKLIDELGLRIFILGRAPPDYLKEKVTWIEGLQSFEFLLDIFRQSNVLFVPAVSDASPRVITQALSLDVPVIVNRNIVGGWKYVNE